MKDFILLMHDDAPPGACEDGWPEYFGRLHASGRFDGGSAIGAGQGFRKAGALPAGPRKLAGYIRVRATDLADAETFLAGNPAYEAGATVEICELPKD